jgi:hypothetical protein
MVNSPTNADLVRLRQFLKTLETDAQRIEVADIDLDGNEIAMLKNEIAYLEDVLFPSKAFLFRETSIDYGAAF